MKNTAGAIFDILVLTLVPGTALQFDQLYRELSLPMLKRWGVQLIAFGPTLHDEHTYLVVRHYKDLEDRQQCQDAFYGSDEWRMGPRERIMSLIESYSSVVISANQNLVDGFRQLNIE